MTNEDFFSIVHIDDQYTDFLYKNGDNRVSFNNNKSYQRPYIGVIFSINLQFYFAPMTTSNKGQKLLVNPKQEDETFLPINNCKNGGINFNNMIPVIDGVVHRADLIPKLTDPKWLQLKKLSLMNAQRFIRRNTDKIIIKAMTLYDKKNLGKLNFGQNRITCNFKRLEITATYFEPFIDKKISSTEIKNGIKNMRGFAEND
ncbi:MAG: type III toxin-antitoxin system ToxN/AbiQ family toxin [Christensenellaceae bacterium]|jgi:hypothetical protein|nr:type III toxin-antitoxin system ToxN/AbiQ family toxin [Christensenellaceae bacterium]